jgi:hypothetical protein
VPWRRELETLDQVLPVDVPDDLPPNIMDLRWTASSSAARARLKRRRNVPTPHRQIEAASSHDRLTPPTRTMASRWSIGSAARASRKLFAVDFPGAG